MIDMSGWTWEDLNNYNRTIKRFNRLPQEKRKEIWNLMLEIMQVEILRVTSIDDALYTACRVKKI